MKPKDESEKLSPDHFKIPGIHTPAHHSNHHHHQQSNQNVFAHKSLKPSGDIFYDSATTGGTHADEPTTVGEHEKKQAEAQFPVTWLPAMVVQNDTQGSYPMDSGDKISSEIIAPGTIVQLPSSFSGGNNNKLYGLVVGNNTVVPIDSLQLMNLPPFSKLPTSPTNDSGDIVVNELKSMVKIDNSGVVTNEHHVGTEIDFGNVHQLDNPTKEDAYCPYCQKHCKNYVDLQSHIVGEHSGMPVEAPQMGTYLSDPNNIHPSLRTCPGCGHQLRRVNSYDQEFTLGQAEEGRAISMGQETDILMICENCGKEYTLGLTSEQTQQPINHEQPKRHFCDHCDKSYKHNRDLRKHMRSHHGIETNVQNAANSSVVSNQYISDSIGGGNNSGQVSFTTPQQNSKIVCTQCKKMFRGPFELRRHVLTVHENKRPYKCPDCGKFFRDAYELKRHSASHQRLHYQNIANSNMGGGDSSTHHDILGLQSSSDAHLNQPGNNSVQGMSRMGTNAGNGLMRDMYSNQQNIAYSSSIGTSAHQPYDYYCSTCEKNFRGANEFRRHYSVVHEKKYRYKCLHCGKLWRDQYDLKRHCRRSHFVDREIDRAFIRQCLLENNETNPQGTSAIGLANYDIGQQVTLTLNHEAAAVIFGQGGAGGDQELHNASTQLENSYPLVTASDINISQSSPTGGLFPNLPSIQPASMLYHSQDASHIVENMIQPQDSESIQEETKNAVNWSNFESDIQSQKG